MKRSALQKRPCEQTTGHKNSNVVGLYEKKIYPTVDGVQNVIQLLVRGNERFTA